MTGSMIQPAALAVVEVSVRFGGVQALEDVSIEVLPGELHGLVGPNGAGKTTLFDVITGLCKPNRGKVVVSGRDVTSMPAHKRARLGLARTFQRLELFCSLPVTENILVGAEAARRYKHAPVVPKDRVDELARILEIEGLLERGVDELSTGTARLVELARALSAAPKVVLLDEPGSGLDEGERQLLSQSLRTVAANGTAVLLVEHDVELVMQTCDRVTVLDAGRVIASGSPEEVRSDERVQAAYLGTTTSSSNSTSSNSTASRTVGAGAAHG